MGSWARTREISSALNQPAGRSGPRGYSAEAVTDHVYLVATADDDAARSPAPGSPTAEVCVAALSGIVVGGCVLYLAATGSNRDWRNVMATTELTGSTIGQTIKDNEIVLVDFWAEWCGPCKRFGPVFEDSSENHPDIVHAKVDTEAEQELAAELQIFSIPTLMAFRDGILVFNQAGALPAPALEQVVEAVKALDMDEVREKIAAAATQA